jgi:hypothetical protein
VPDYRELLFEQGHLEYQLLDVLFLWRLVVDLLLDY